MKHNALKSSGHVALAVLLVLFSHPALAATIIVDETTCTLVDAITAANTDTAVGGCAAGSGADTIELTTDVMLTEVNNGDNGLPVVETDITIEGGDFTIERDADAPPFRLLRVTGTLTIRSATITNGHSDTGGGGILVTDYPVPGASLTLTNSTVSGNRASGGGGISGHYASVHLINSTLSGNHALLGSGGGVSSSYYGSMTITNSTLSGNTAFGFGDAIVAAGTAPVSLTNTVVLGNIGENVLFGAISIANSIVVGGCFSDEDDINDLGNNFGAGDVGECQFTPITPGVDFDTNLADNGGPTQTHALFPGSVAIDAAGDCGLETDQRGFPRDDGACDSGSFEQQMCGNGIVDPGEECDDGSNADGDGCASDCTLEEPVPASSSLGLLLLLVVLMTVSWAILKRPLRYEAHKP